ncbi:glycoside hydrolase family 29 [Phocaeicola plebeius]|uniref:alpha-L-fucosidase n=2 Tax=Phocaeicola plebeius TaxID=310297 RepID=A0A3E4MX30_9BACT|nr:glycoside hydrolase family 29 [Phocaeicola plebeius]MBS4811782.1 alpha-L-fucosidase [Bacteroides sp.]MBS4826852.1 alpha-L-fucosidase [Bacteroides sp.]RGK54074.1 glycoside hydrolase family 29 [Phocaeicola plebeius]RGM40838.1 glycoside hydrolase family 29 [Phocaeicola plebeius]
MLPPEPILPVPEPKQVEWQQMETYAFIHFGLNTFNDREWGYGDTDPKTFNPTNLDCEQWAQTLVKAGMKGVILTAKHHDGFCLWPFEGTDYSVKNSPWKNGQGNVVKELSEACKKYGLKFAVYLSPWDRHQANYGTPEYLPYFYAQLHDLLTNYGPVFEVWFDGANGGDGWYGGAKDIRTIDRKNYYNYPRIYEMLDSIQPQAIIFSDGGPGCRWVGNEKGFAGATNWSFLRKGEVHPGYDKSYELQYGHPDGNQWVPAECDVSIRPGWFYHPEEDDRVKSPDQLVDLYYRSVGHNATLLLNFPVDRRGLIHPVDSANAVRFHEMIQQQLKTNLVAGMTPKVSNERGGDFVASALTDDNFDTYWATEDGVTTADIEFSFDTPTRMNRMMLQEYIPLGQRVKAFVVEYLDKDTWLPVKLNEETTTIGYKRLLRFETVETKGIRIRITDARGPLCLSNVGVYDAGNVSDSFVEKVEDIESVPYLLPDVKAEETAKASDKQAQTTCFVEGDRLLIDLQEERLVSSLHFLPDQGEPNKGLIANYEIRVGTSKDAVNQLVKSGEFSNIQNNPVMQSVFFTPVKARYIELKATRMIRAGEPMGFAELRVK